MKKSQAEIESGDLFVKKSKQMPIMDQIVNTPGLQHIIEMIFFNLDFEDLMNCQSVNKSCKNILENPMFWLKKWSFDRGLSKKNQVIWIKALRMTKNTNLETNVVLYIKKIIKIGHFVDVPCYIEDHSVKKATEISFEDALCQKDVGVIQILAPMARIINAPNTKLHEILGPYKRGRRSFYDEPEFLDIDVIKVLAPLVKNFDDSNNRYSEYTTIHHAAFVGQLDVIRFLAPLTENPNAVGYGGTPIHQAAWKGHLDIIKFLTSLTDNPNTPNNFRYPNLLGAYYIATERRYHETAQFLRSYIFKKNPNSSLFD